jgi:hypothetical protein
MLSAVKIKIDTKILFVVPFFRLHKRWVLLITSAVSQLDIFLSSRALMKKVTIKIETILLTML